MKRILATLFVVQLLIIGTVFAEEQGNEPPEERTEMIQVLQEMDELVTEDVFEWVVSQYDMELGGFYHARSSRDNSEFFPDLESTIYALDMMVNAGILPVDENGKILEGTLSSTIVDRMTNFVKNLQDEEDGFFYHPQWQKNIIESRKNRDLSAAINILRRMGAEALYVLPADRISQEDPDERELPPYLQSEEALLAWMNNHWDSGTPYSAGNVFGSALSQIRAAGLLDTAVAFITEKQNPDTGLWGEGLNYINSNAAMKLVGFYQASEIPFPHIEKMIESMTTIIIKGDEEPQAVVDVWNPIFAINGALDSHAPISPELRASLDEVIIPLAEISIEKIKPFGRDDGGYSYGRRTSSVTSQGAYVGYGLEEGDMNATIISINQLRNSLYRMAGMESEPLFKSTDFAHQLIQQWESLPPVHKIEKPIGLNEDFDSIVPGNLPPRYFKTVSGGNRVEVAADPLDPNNQALLIGRQALNANSRLNILVESGENDGKPKKTTVSMDLMIESPVTGTLFYNDIGTDAVQWVISGHADGFSLSNRRSGAGIGTTFSGRLAYGEWHNLKVEYIPGGVHNTLINYYIDDELMLSTNEYFNRGNASIQPASSIQNIRFDNFLSAGLMNLYVDHLHMTVEELPEEPLGLDEDFEQIGFGELPARFHTTIGGANRIEVTADPLNPSNRALRIERNTLNVDSRLNIAVNGGQNPYKTTVSMNIMLESPVTGNLFYNDVGTDAVQWVIVGHADGFTLSNRRSGAGIGTVFSDRLAYGKWHHLTIEYYPVDREQTLINYFIDGELKLSTNEYFNRGNASIEPAPSIETIRFDHFLAAGRLDLYVDDLRMDVELTSAATIKERVERFAQNGDLENEQAVRALNMHLAAVEVFEQQEQGEKVVQHMEGFRVLLDHQKELGWISEQAYHTLKADTDELIEIWQP